MAEWYHFLMVVILLTVIGKIPRIFIGPTRADVMVAAPFYGTASVAMLLLLSAAQDNPFLNDVALVFALFAAAATIHFVRLAWQNPLSENERGDGDR